MTGIESKYTVEGNFEECLKCTVCTAYCPVLEVRMDYPGPKAAGPDSERYRLKSPEFFDKTLKYCLNCKRCETACPSGVRIGDIIQAARIKYDRQRPRLRDRMLAETDIMGRAASFMAPLANPVLKNGIAKTALHVLGIDRHRSFPAYSHGTFASYLRKIQDCQKRFDRHVAYFHGCYVNYNFPELGKDFVRIMNAVGYGVLSLERQKCCGVAKIANNLIGRARHDAEINLSAIRKAVGEGLQVISTSSTCAFTIRDEYPHLLGLENADVRDHLLLATVFLVRKAENGEIKLVFRDGYRKRVAYHAPCHLRRLGWEAYTLSLLRMIPGLELVRMPAECCGMAGTYGFKRENYYYSQKIGRKLVSAIMESGVEAVVTDCETCKWQIEMNTGREVVNPVSVIADALDFEATAAANENIGKLIESML